MKMNMKLTLSVLGGFLLTIILFFMFAPPNRVAYVKAEWARFIGDAGQICLDQYSDQLKDPASARLILAFKENQRIYIVYKAKNSYGAYNKGAFDCPLDNSGNVDMAKTGMERTAALIKRLQD